MAITYPVINGWTKIHYGLTVPYLKLTCDLNFNNSWILASACESAMVDEGSSSLSQAFLNLGAGGYNGYDRSIAAILANAAEVKMTYELTSGRSFKEASRTVRLDPILLEVSFVLRLLYWDNPEFVQACHISLFDDNQTSTEPFYLKPPCVDADGKTYKTVKIGNQWWMAENLAYLPSVGPYDIQSVINPMYYVYDYLGTNVNEAKATENYRTYGVLYNWPAAKSACPIGWHLPSDEEWRDWKYFWG